MNVEWLQKIYFKRIRVFYRVLDEGYISGWPPRKIRAVFKAIIQAASPCLDQRGNNCKTCSYQGHCIYFQLMQEKENLDYLPYVIHIDNYHSWLGKIDKNNSYSFDVVLLGRYSELLETIDAFIKRKPLISIKGVDHKNIVFELADIQYPGNGEIITITKLLESLPYVTPTDTIEHIRIKLITPLNMTLNQKPLTEPGDISFRSFMEIVWRRLTGIATSYCGVDKIQGGLEEYDYYLAKVETIWSPGKLRFARREAVKYSNSGVTKEKIGGFVGEISFSGVSGALFPLIVMGEALHVGSKTTQGLGQYRVVDIRTG